jgi:hypothetical protein
MSALTTAAIIGLAVSAGASTASAAIQAHQAGKAVDAQTDASNKALAAQQEQFRTQQQAASPYQQAGQMTLGRLGQMAAQPAAQFNPANYQGGVPRMTPQQPSMPQQQQMPGMQQGGQSPTVTIQTPDGRVLPGFPRTQLQEAMQRGAKVMG